MTRLQKYIALIGISLLSFTGFLDITIVSTALPAIQSSLHLSVTELQWVMNACFLTISAFMASMGRIADIYGRRKIFYLGIIFFGLASLGAGLSTHAIELILFRAIQGITIAITVPVAVALIQTIFTQNETAKAMGIFATVTGSGLALGPVVGGALVTAFGWPSVFFVNIPFVIIGFALCLFIVKESRSLTEMSLDYLGILFLVLTIGFLVFAVVEANSLGWNSCWIIGSFIIAVISFICLILAEKKAQHPIMAAALFRNSVFVSNMFYAFAGGALMAIVLFINPLYLHLILNKSIWMTGVILFIIPLAVVLSSPLIGQVNHRYGAKKVLIAGAICYLLTALGHLLLGLESNYLLLSLTFILFGFGWAIMNQVPAVALGQAIHQDHLSVAIGALFTFYNVGSSLMLAICVTLFHWRMLAGLQQGLANKHILLQSTQENLLAQLVNQPDQMSVILNQLHLLDATNLFKTAFMSGMHAMYIPLAFLSLLALMALKKMPSV